MSELFDKHGGFRKLHSFTLATLVQLETLRFCRRLLTHDHRLTPGKFYDPKGRQYDQMTQAARSGRQNIIEGSERSSTSKDTEMKLTDVARASLSELRGDLGLHRLPGMQGNQTDRMTLLTPLTPSSKAAASAASTDHARTHRRPRETRQGAISGLRAGIPEHQTRGGKAAVAMPGGNVELKSEEELRDMRLWSHQAARANGREFKISKMR
jgi:hypothetical protein